MIKLVFFSAVIGLLLINGFLATSTSSSAQAGSYADPNSYLEDGNDVVYDNYDIDDNPPNEDDIEPTRNVLGGTSNQIPVADAKRYTNAVFDKLAQLGVFLRLGQIVKTSKQVVSGFKYNLNVIAVDANGVDEACNISIWSRVWLANGNEVTMYCDRLAERKFSIPNDAFKN